jgi:branched-chain amino acid transport system substrate-binding protein
MAPFSGLAAAFGQEMLKGGQMALDEANGAGGIGGRRVLFDQADDKAEASAAPAAAQKLISDGVAAVVGPATSASALAAEASLNQAKLPTITPSANDPRITDQALPFIFRAAGRWDQEPPLLADFLLKQPATAKVAVVADKSEYGQTLASGMRQALAKANAQPLADETVDSGAKDLGPLVAKLKAQSPGAVFYAGYAADGGALAKALRAAGVQAALAMGDAAEDQALIASGGPAAEGLTFAYPPDPKQTATAAAVLDAYKRRYGTAASLYAISTYDTVRLVLDALRRAGSTDGEAVRQALAASDFNGAYWGKMSFDAKGDPRARTYTLWTVRGGRFEERAASQ